MEETNSIIDQWEQEITEQAELEALNEVGIYKGEGILIRIDAVDTEEKGFPGDPYIKVFDSESYSKAKHELRISIDDARIIDHADHFKSMKVNSSLVKKLNKIVNNSKSNLGNHKGETVIDALYNTIDDKYGKGSVKRKDYIDFSDYYTGPRKDHNDNKSK